MDHNYSKPWNWKPENSLIKQTKVVFKNSNSIYHEINNDQFSDAEDIVVDDLTVLPTFHSRNEPLMSESESQANMTKSECNDSDWEETISRNNWTYYQNYLFDKMVKILNKDQISRLTYAGHKNEPILRKTIIESSVKRARRLFGAVFWDLYLVQWLHVLLIQHLNASYLTIYLDILKGLKTKLPSTIEQMISVSNNALSKYNAFAPETLKGLLNEEWTPINENALFNKVKSLPSNSIILLIPSSPKSCNSKYTTKWLDLLSVLTKTILVDFSQTNDPNLTMTQCADNMIFLIRNKLSEIRSEQINKNIVLIGLGSTGSAFACQIAVLEHSVSCVICLGFATRTVNGYRGEPDDCIIEIQCPILFIIGQNSNKTNHMDMEDLREKLKTETGLIIVSNADDNLRVSHKKCLDDLITQEYVLKKILDEISDFICGLLSSSYTIQVKQPIVTIDNDYINKSKEKRRSVFDIDHSNREYYQSKQKKSNESREKCQKLKMKERKVSKSGNQSFYLSNVSSPKYVYANDNTANTSSRYQSNSESYEYVVSYTDNTNTDTTHLNENQYISGADFIELVDN